VKWVLREGLGLPGEVLHEPSDENGEFTRFAVQVLEHQEWLSPDWVVMGEVPRLLVMVAAPTSPLPFSLVNHCQIIG